MEWLLRILPPWVEKHALLIAYVEFILLTVGLVGRVISYFLQRKERKRAEERHRELLAKMAAMVGKPVEQQRRILREAHKQVAIQESLEIVLTGPDGKVKEHRWDDS